MDEKRRRRRRRTQRVTSESFPKLSNAELKLRFREASGDSQVERGGIVVSEGHVREEAEQTGLEGLVAGRGHQLVVRV